MTDAELHAIRERLREATPGPWEAGEDACGAPCVRVTNPVVLATNEWAADEDGRLLDGNTFTEFADVVFVAHARADVPALLAEVDRLRGIIEGLAARVSAQSELLSRRVEKVP